MARPTRRACGILGGRRGPFADAVGLVDGPKCERGIGMPGRKSARPADACLCRPRSGARFPARGQWFPALSLVPPATRGKPRGGGGPTRHWPRDANLAAIIKLRDVAWRNAWFRL